MNPEHKKKIEEIMGNMECPYDFRCRKSEFNNLCKVKYENSGVFLECIDIDIKDCKFRFRIDKKHYCRCPLRIHTFKTLKR